MSSTIQSHPAYKDKLVDLASSKDIPAQWAGTPIEQIIQAQNFGYPLHSPGDPQALIVSCMDFRYAPPIPAHYAYVIRTPGSRLIGAELAVGYVLSRGVKDIVLIAHNDCGMTKLVGHRHKIADAFEEQGWNKEKSHQFLDHQIPKHGFENELDALEQEYHRLNKLFKNVRVAPLFLVLEEKRVYLPSWFQHIIHKQPGQSTERVSDDEIHKLIR